MPSEAVATLVSLASQGEARGPVTAVSPTSDPPTVTIDDQFTGGELRLNFGPDSPLSGDVASLGLSSLPQILVAASYDPVSLAILNLDRLAIYGSQQTFRGVVHSFIPKVQPGNMLVLTSRRRTGGIQPHREHDRHQGRPVDLHHGGPRRRPHTAHIPAPGDQRRRRIRRPPSPPNWSR